MGSPMALSKLTLIGLDSQKSRSLRFRGVISHEAAELGHMLLLNVSRKQQMDSPMAHLTFDDLEFSKARFPNF